MKNFRNIMLVLALALVFVGAVNVTKASAAEPVIKYEYEYVTITEVDAPVYYQVVKKADANTGLKPANWIPAAVKEKTYYIDFSALSNTKDAYIAWTTDNTSDKGTVVTIDAKVKSLKVTLNYAQEEVTAGLDQIISEVTVKGVDKADDKADVAPAKYAFLWKRGANGAWKEEGEFDQLTWDMVKASNATLYISVAGGDGEKESPSAYTYRPSKEAKVKIPKAAKAPNVKVDFVKGTVALKNGMQVREVGEEAWTNVSPYDKAETTNAEIFNADATKKTKTKVSTVLVGDLLTALGTKVADGNEIKLEVRTAATDKKFASNIANVSFKTPASATAVAETTAITYVAADKAAKVKAEFTIDFATILESQPADGKYDVYEYILVKSTEDKVNFAKQKWTKVPEDGKLNLASKLGKTYKYVKEDGTNVTPKYEETTAIYIRKAADKENSLFPSKMSTAKVTLTAEKLYAITVPTTLPAGITEISYQVGEGTALKAKKGEKVTLAIELEDGYTISAVKAGDKALEAADGVYSFTMGEADVAITVTVTAPATPTPEAGAGA